MLPLRALCLLLLASPLCALCLLLLASPPLFADERASQLKFEDEVVEGVNKQSTDSLTQLSEDEDRQRKGHLYDRKKSFEEANKEMARELIKEKE